MSIELTVPANWSEVTAEQLRTIVELTGAELNRETFLLVLLCKFTGIKMVAGTASEDNKRVVRTRFKAPNGNLFDLEDWQIADFCDKLSYIIDEIPHDIACPFKWDRHLIDISFGDWFHADALMLRYFTTQDPEYMKVAMSDLGDPHDSLTPIDIELMMLWWNDFKDWLIETYPLVFRKADPSTENIVSPIQTRQNIMLMLNDRRPQDNAKIEESNMHDVLSALQFKIEESEELKRKMRHS